MPRQPGTYAIFNTSEGTIVCRLFEKDAPKTVANFTELAEGKRDWTHPVSGKKTKDRLYDGTIFHRVIPNFMIQGGDPAGTGFGGPGYQFEDETKGSPHKFDKAGKLAMANAGPNTNRSEEHTSELQSQSNLVCRLLLEKKNKYIKSYCIIPTLPALPVTLSEYNAYLVSFDLSTTSADDAVVSDLSTSLSASNIASWRVL